MYIFLHCLHPFPYSKMIQELVGCWTAESVGEPPDVPLQEESEFEESELEESFTVRLSCYSIYISKSSERAWRSKALMPFHIATKTEAMNIITHLIYSVGVMLCNASTAKLICSINFETDVFSF